MVSQFFWHEVLKDINNDYKNECINILKNYNPTIFGDKYFSMKYIKQSENYIPTGLFSLRNNIKKKSPILLKKKNILITGGNTSQSINILRKIIVNIQTNFCNYFDKIFVDERLYPQNPILKVKKFNYSRSQFEQISACICRPGLGILSDCLENNIKVFTVFEKNNFEMIHNSNCLLYTSDAADEP